jgi:hypothetical protein
VRILGRIDKVAIEAVAATSTVGFCSPYLPKGAASHHPLSSMEMSRGTGWLRSAALPHFWIHVTDQLSLRAQQRPMRQSTQPKLGSAPWLFPFHQLPAKECNLTRRICLAICALQLLILLALFGLIHLSSSGAVSREVGDPIFMISGILFVLLSPFGLLSLFMSVGFSLLSKLPGFRPGLAKLVSSGSIGMRIVWKEFRNHFE